MTTTMTKDSYSEPAQARAAEAEQLAHSHGHLVIIGGGEDRKHDKEILSRFVDLAGGSDARIVVITEVAPRRWWRPAPRRHPGRCRPGSRCRSSSPC